MSEKYLQQAKIAVVIPAYKVTKQLAQVVAAINADIWKIYVVDDACPEHCGALLQKSCEDPRLTVLFHVVNKGVGGAVITGYRQAISDGADIIVKVDGDGQMNPDLIPNIVAPLLSGQADYAKGNRFYDLESTIEMPKVRLIGNAVLSLMSKISTGYWDLFDPTNGFTAIQAPIAKLLPLDKVSERYFFETDMLFRLNTIRAVAVDVPMVAKYGDEKSNLKISAIVGEFLGKHLNNFGKRVFYNYYLRDMSLASIQLPLGILLILAGASFGVYHWYASAQIGVVTPAGTVMLAALPILMGLQFILAFLSYDIATVPKRPRHT